jgi:transcriptional regulator with XRE-family HTH domain
MELFRINELLIERGITFGELSEGIGVGRTNLYNYISETNNTIVVLKKISEYLGVSIRDLFSKEESFVRGYLELGERVYVIDCSEDITQYQEVLAEYLQKNNNEK